MTAGGKPVYMKADGSEYIYWQVDPTDVFGDPVVYSQWRIGPDYTDPGAAVHSTGGDGSSMCPNDPSLGWSVWSGLISW